ncbi:Armadillo-like helical [Corchorus capsularis]|uniref:Armadillo-like helical n=1 Tax=Corchorus capsularis TaxID=210143 RepID=A0A1R3I111_COCAP|nr:Armadillo-like helical [Corchorus capsularis]
MMKRELGFLADSMKRCIHLPATSQPSIAVTSVRLCAMWHYMGKSTLFNVIQLLFSDMLDLKKLKFFTRVRRFLQSKTARKRYGPSTSDHANKLRITSKNITDQKEAEVIMQKEETEQLDDDSVVLQKSVKRLHFGSWEEKEMAAKAIEKLAKEDVKARKLMAELGVINMLVSMVATEVVGRRRAAIKALIELANGTFT